MCENRPESLRVLVNPGLSRGKRAETGYPKIHIIFVYKLLCHPAIARRGAALTTLRVDFDVDIHLVMKSNSFAAFA